MHGELEAQEDVTVLGLIQFRDLDVAEMRNERKDYEEAIRQFGS